MNETNDLYKIRHSLAHVLAWAVKELYPDAKPAIGPVIDNGFYYDFDDLVISEADLPALEAKMKQLIKSGGRVDKRILNAEEALAKEVEAMEPYKTELIRNLQDEGETEVSYYKIGGFEDLCRGPHIDDLKELGGVGFKLSKLAGAYWRGDEKNKMLTRIYGLAFAKKAELEEHLEMLAEAEKRDHKKLGKELDLFTFSELVGSGLPLWTPKGTVVRNLLDEFVWQLRARYAYDKVEIPHITKKDLYIKSGHWDKFQDELFKITTREGHEFAMKPMNCPHHTQVYARRQWSYRDLPQRYANSTACYRDEQSGELSGLSRARSFTQDDAHVFCRFEQSKEEFLKIWDIVHEFYNAFGFELELRLSLHNPAEPTKYLGDEERWQKAEAMLREIITEKGAVYHEGVGEAAFYGPKLDFMAKDSLKRQWQVATIQLDMNMPERFDLYCVNERGEQERIVMIHAAIMGSIERFLSILIEHYAGAFPVWLSPVQVKLMSVGEAHRDFCSELSNELTTAGIRTELDLSDETVGNKTRKAAGEKIPYLLVIGDKEMSSKDLNIRDRGSRDTRVLSREDFIAEVIEKNKQRL